MEVTLHIPDDVAKQLSAAGGDISRRALEAIALEGYRDQTLTLYQVSEMLGLSRIETEDFLAGIRCRWLRLAGRIWSGRRHYSKRHRAATRVSIVEKSPPAKTADGAPTTGTETVTETERSLDCVAARPEAQDARDRRPPLRLIG